MWGERGEYYFLSQLKPFLTPIARGGEGEERWVEVGNYRFARKLTEVTSAIRNSHDLSPQRGEGRRGSS